MLKGEVSGAMGVEDGDLEENVSVAESIKDQEDDLEEPEEAAERTPSGGECIHCHHWKSNADTESHTCPTDHGAHNAWQQPPMMIHTEELHDLLKFHWMCLKFTGTIASPETRTTGTWCW